MPIPIGPESVILAAAASQDNDKPKNMKFSRTHWLIILTVTPFLLWVLLKFVIPALERH